MSKMTKGLSRSGPRGELPKLIRKDSLHSMSNMQPASCEFDMLARLSPGAGLCSVLGVLGVGGFYDHPLGVLVEDLPP